MGSLIKFIIGCGGVYASFIFYGLFQEKLFRSEYPSQNNPEDKQKFTFAFPILLFQTFFAAIIGFIATLKQDRKQPIPLMIQAKSGLFNTISMLGSNTALAYVSYPLQALFKSCKVLSVLVVGLFFGQFKYRPLQYVAGFLVTLGIVGFNLQSSKTGGETQIIGIALLILSLLSDGLLANSQNELRSEHKPSSFELMYITSKFSFIFGTLYGVITMQFPAFLSFVYNRPSVISDIVSLGLCGSVGQIFIFYTIKHFGPNKLAIITTTRKLFTVLCSIFYYGHSVSVVQWIFIVIVFVGVFTEFYDAQLKKKEAQKKKLQQQKQEEEISLKETPREHKKSD